MTPPGEDDGELGIGAITRTSEASEASETSGPDAVSEVQDAPSPTAASGIAPVGAADSAASAQSTAAISQDLATGAIDASEARARLIDEAVRSQLPEGADPALIEQVRSEVAALLASDPILDTLLDPHR